MGTHIIAISERWAVRNGVRFLKRSAWFHMCWPSVYFSCETTRVQRSCLVFDLASWRWDNCSERRLMISHPACSRYFMVAIFTASLYRFDLYVYSAVVVQLHNTRWPVASCTQGRLWSLDTWWRMVVFSERFCILLSDPFSYMVTDIDMAIYIWSLLSDADTTTA